MKLGEILKRQARPNRASYVAYEPSIRQTTIMRLGRADGTIEHLEWPWGNVTIGPGHMYTYVEFESQTNTHRWYVTPGVPEIIRNPYSNRG